MMLPRIRHCSRRPRLPSLGAAAIGSNSRRRSTPQHGRTLTTSNDSGGANNNNGTEAAKVENDANGTIEEASTRQAAKPMLLRPPPLTIPKLAQLPPLAELPPLDIGLPGTDLGGTSGGTGSILAHVGSAGNPASEKESKTEKTAISATNVPLGVGGLTSGGSSSGPSSSGSSAGKRAGPQKRAPRTFDLDAILSGSSAASSSSGKPLEERAGPPPTPQTAKVGVTAAPSPPIAPPTFAALPSFSIDDADARSDAADRVSATTMTKSKSEYAFSALPTFSDSSDTNDTNQVDDDDNDEDKFFSALPLDTSRDETRGSHGNAGAGLLSLMRGMDVTRMEDMETSVSQGKNGGREDAEGGPKEEEGGGEEGEGEEEEEPEHVQARVTFHPLTTEPHGGGGAGAATHFDALPGGGGGVVGGGGGGGTSSSGGANSEEGFTTLPRADLTGLLPPGLAAGSDGGTGTGTGTGSGSGVFQATSLLEGLFDPFPTKATNEGDADGVGDGESESGTSSSLASSASIQKMLKKTMGGGGGLPNAYRIQKEPEQEDKNGGGGSGGGGGKGRRRKRGQAEQSRVASFVDGSAVPPPRANDRGGSVMIRSIRGDRPTVRYGTDTIAPLAKGSAVAASGKTVVMSTVVHKADDSASTSASASHPHAAVAQALRAECRKYTGLLPLTVSYSERYAGVGKIPSNASRRDNMRPTEAETLASRAIDRALRPLLSREFYGPDDALEVHCSVQACDLTGAGGGGDPLATAINAASAALVRSNLPYDTPVAAVRLCLDQEGDVIIDPSPQQMEEAQLDLLVAATREDIVMVEFGGRPPRSYREADGAEVGSVYATRDPGIPEEVVADLLRIAHASIHDLLDDEVFTGLDECDIRSNADSDFPSDAQLLAELGLDTSDTSILKTNDEPLEKESISTAAKLIAEEAFSFISAKLADAAIRLFGSEHYGKGPDAAGASVHDGISLMPKAIRGRREHLVRQEIARLLSSEFALQNTYQEAILGDKAALDLLISATHERVLKRMMYCAAVDFGTRGDGRTSSTNGRQGLLTVRPIEARTPVLPDTVHGSSLFSRGETTTLCTTTLGSPRDGLPITNPFVPPQSSSSEANPENTNDPYSEIPVGSLRFLKNQQALESDLNSKRVRADKEMTGDSGTLSEVRRAFLHYDFPDWSTGDVRSKGPAVNRRAIGHGALSERGILPILPPPAAFPYTIRMTSEVTSSNGSSSMASVCGATLSLLDAGVPILAPAAAVSVGLVRGDSGDEEESFGLLLDITGTEDHYGEMDFKIAGTEAGLTAMQLDVKRPVPLDVVIQALQVAKDGRAAILSSMSAGAKETSGGIIKDLKPRRRLKDTAPRVEIVRFDPVRKRDLVGPGGAVLKQLEDRYSISIDLSQEGQCLLYGSDQAVVSKAKNAVMDLVADVVEGETYEGTVIEIKDFGAVIELLRNKEALLHVSELGGQGGDLNYAEGNLGLVRKELEVGQKIKVLCIGVDPVQGDIKVSRRRLLQQELSA